MPFPEGDAERDCRANHTRLCEPFHFVQLHAVTSWRCDCIGMRRLHCDCTALRGTATSRQHYRGRHFSDANLSKRFRSPTHDARPTPAPPCHTTPLARGSPARPPLSTRSRPPRPTLRSSNLSRALRRFAPPLLHRRSFPTLAATPRRLSSLAPRPRRLVSATLLRPHHLAPASATSRDVVGTRTNGKYNRFPAVKSANLSAP